MIGDSADTDHPNPGLSDFHHIFVHLLKIKFGGYKNHKYTMTYAFNPFGFLQESTILKIRRENPQSKRSTKITRNQ